MPQAVWVGELSFGLVNIPVKLYAATSPRRVRFHQYDSRTGRRVRYRRVVEGPAPSFDPPEADEAPAPPPDFDEPSGARVVGAPRDEESRYDVAPARSDFAPEPEVPWEEIVKGYEIEPGRVVTVDPDELESVAPERSRTLEVEEFVDLKDIDPVYFEKSYFVAPQRGVAERAYWLFYRAMEQAGKVAVGRFVMRTKEYLTIVRPAEHALMLETLFYPDEIRDSQQLWIPAMQDPPERELQVAQQFLDALAGEWEPSRHRDEHRERLLELLYSKADTAMATSEPDETETPTAPLIDLMEALKASVEAAKQARAERSESGEESTA